MKDTDSEKERIKAFNFYDIESYGLFQVENYFYITY